MSFPPIVLQVRLSIIPSLYFALRLSVVISAKCIRINVFIAALSFFSINRLLS